MEMCVHRLEMSFYHGTMHIGSWCKMQRDSKLRGLHLLFLLIKQLSKHHRMCLTSGLTHQLEVWSILSDRKWTDIDYILLVVLYPLMNILFTLRVSENLCIWPSIFGRKRFKNVRFTLYSHCWCIRVFVFYSAGGSLPLKIFGQSNEYICPI